MNPQPPKHPIRPKAWRTPTVTLAAACLCATAWAAPPGLPDMPPEKPGPTAAELDAQKRASQQAVQQAERRAADQRAAAQREADQAKAEKASAEARARKEEQAREAAEVQTKAAQAKARELEKRLAAAEASTKAAREAQENANKKARDTAEQATTVPLQREAEQAKSDKAAAEARAKKEQQAREAAEAKTRELERKLAEALAAAGQAKKVVTPPPPATIPDFTPLPSVAGGPVFVALPLGSFEMGSTIHDPDERPPHPVRVSQRIAMSEMEVTTAQYMACANDNRQGKPACDQPQWNEAGSDYNLQTGSDKYYQKLMANDQPVVGVTWHNARQYAAWLSRETGHSYKLPNEAEWEFACRAGGTHTYCGSDDVNAVAWHSNNSGAQTHPVGSKAKKNAWGLFDMSGNVWEWVADCYNNNEYQRRKGTGRAWLAHRTSEEKPNCSRVLRGGSWLNSSDNLRSASRDYISPDLRDNIIGFRLSRTLP